MPQRFTVPAIPEDDEFLAELGALKQHPQYGALFTAAWTTWTSGELAPRITGYGVRIRYGKVQVYDDDDNPAIGCGCLVGAAVLGQPVPLACSSVGDVAGALFGLHIDERNSMYEGFDGTDLGYATFPAAYEFGKRAHALISKVWVNDPNIARPVIDQE